MLDLPCFCSSERPEEHSQTLEPDGLQPKCVQNGALWHCPCCPRRSIWTSHRRLPHTRQIRGVARGVQLRTSEMCWWLVATSLSRASMACPRAPPCRGGTAPLSWYLLPTEETHPLSTEALRSSSFSSCGMLGTLCCYDQTPRPKVTMEGRIYLGLWFWKDEFMVGSMAERGEACGLSRKLRVHTLNYKHEGNRQNNPEVEQSYSCSPQ